MAKKSILIVDDSATVRKALSTALLDAGYSVTEAKDGSEALAKAPCNHFDLVMTDLNMPEMNGIRLISEFRKVPGQLFTPVVVLSEEPKMKRYSECLAAGASGYLQKPFHKEQLLGILKMIIPH